MKIKLKGGLAAAGVLLLLCLSFPAYGTKKELEAEKEKISVIEEEKKKVEDTLKNLEGQKADTESYVRQLDQEMAAISSQLEELSGQIADKESEIAVTQEELSAAQEAEVQQYDAMKLRIKYMYEKGDTTFIDLILESKSISQLLNRAEYISQISQYDRQMLDEYAATRQTIADNEAKLESERADLLALQESTQAKHNSVEELLAAKEEQLKSYETQIASAQSQINAYEQDLAAQESKIRQIEEEMQKAEEEARKKAESSGTSYTVKSLGNTKFIWPCPSSSRITSAFGGRESPTEGASSNHQGIDIGASTGSDIVAAADGVVTIATYSASAGNYVMLSHGGGVSTVYMHCSSLNVSEGQSVTQGQVIAKVGSTGYSTGPHLHFGIRSGGSYVNPSNYVSP
ncbi:MAG TPA: peptidoglycan DD-metalloendopeptidase family protein [Candidatus Caccovicinus merdipullorum]|uniref:Peptidoglycan DD-metalloendopeptidase family protein n=1 Tax=Candidatus Caccovicinus merdipullorum TaxID=2840724 RepID=A0A9D1GKP0_9FIRM|nr:peptidoglycan DD-metalloendopeptidase family protein [Candidatus Caccovicinus merdipullorum]